MNTRAQLKKFEESLDVILSITKVFEHTATQKIAVNKNEIARLNQHLGEVKQTYMSAKVSITRKNAQLPAVYNTIVRKPKGSKVVLLVSSEPQYYGNLLVLMAQEFISEVESGAKGVVIGKPGKEEVDKRAKKTINYQFFNFIDDKPDWQIINKISEILFDYSQILVIFSHFRSILSQDVVIEDIAKRVAQSTPAAYKKYLIKPTAKDVLESLEKHLLTGALLEKLYQNGLAKSAVRVKILEIGEIAERLTVAIDKFKKYKAKVNRAVNNKKLISLYSGSSIWREKSIFTVYR